MRQVEGTRSRLPGARPARSPGAGPLRVAILSFLWPGLAHALLRLRRPALILAIPTLVVVGFWLILFLVRGGAGFAISLISPPLAWAFMLSFILVGM